MNRRALLLAPLAAAGIAGVGAWITLSRMRTGGYDPRGIPSQMIGKPAPQFDTMPPIDDATTGFGTADLRTGRPLLVNFFASWCVACIIESPILMSLYREGIPIWGIAYKDKPADTRGFLVRYGNPFARIAMDLSGRVAIEWGLYGVPETYLLDGNGTVLWRYAGALTPDIVDGQLRPMMQAAA